MRKGAFSMTPQKTIATKPSGKISAFIVCMNEEKNIRRCLDSLKWCDEIIVVDSGSSDTTLDICREYNTKIFQRPWPGFVEQKRFALSQCTNEWILNLDSDEEVSSALR
jgi:glycosyltransferase involved in cell wall biosynthesis